MFNKYETANILAALRCFQKLAHGIRGTYSQVKEEGCQAMTEEEIDALCEKINFMEPEIMIVMKGGALRDAWANVPGIRLTTVDCDTEGVDSEDIRKTPTGEECCVIEHGEQPDKHERSEEYHKAFNGETKKFKVEVCRRYYATKTYEVEAIDETQARGMAESLSGDEDFSGRLQLEEVEVEVEVEVET